jgi:hypothetical protein
MPNVSLIAKSRVQTPHSGHFLDTPFTTMEPRVFSNNRCTARLNGNFGRCTWKQDTAGNDAADVQMSYVGGRMFPSGPAMMYRVLGNNLSLAFSSNPVFGTNHFPVYFSNYVVPGDDPEWYEWDTNGTTSNDQVTDDDISQVTSLVNSNNTTTATGGSGGSVSGITISPPITVNVTIPPGVASSGSGSSGSGSSGSGSSGSGSSGSGSDPFGGLLPTIIEGIGIAAEAGAFALTSAGSGSNPPGTFVDSQALWAAAAGLSLTGSNNGVSIKIQHGAVQKLQDAVNSDTFSAIEDKPLSAIPLLLKYATRLRDADHSGGNQGATLHYNPSTDAVKITPGS